jgi:hypothetical protein
MCGCSFEHRFCVKFHKNPRWVKFCLQCGSNQLSTPHPATERRFLIVAAGFGVVVVAGLLLYLVW